MLKAGKPSEASKHLAQGLEMLVRGSWQQQHAGCFVWCLVWSVAAGDLRRACYLPVGAACERSPFALYVHIRIRQVLCCYM